MSITVDYEPIEYTFEGGLWECEHASVHDDIREFVGESYDWVRTCDDCHAWFNELTNEWVEA